MPYLNNADELVIVIDGKACFFWKAYCDGKIMVPGKTKEQLPDLSDQIDSVNDLLWELNYFGYGEIKESQVGVTGRTDVCFFDDY